MTSTLLFFSFSHYWETVETSSTMDKLDFYADAVAWLEEAALESKKTDNVDVDILITNCKNTLHCVQILLPLEQDLLKVVRVK